MRFEGTPGYIATDDLQIAVNAAIVLQRPLLVKWQGAKGNSMAHVVERGNSPLPLRGRVSCGT